MQLISCTEEVPIYIRLIFNPWIAAKPVFLSGYLQRRGSGGF